ncbi:MAG: START-like domain-containing protein [Bacteroidota bacterium]
MKTKYELEYTFNTSPRVLFDRLSTPSGLSEWFADDVNVVDGTYTFFWDGTEMSAEIVQLKENTFIRFKWIDEEEEDQEEDQFFEFRINTHELTGDVALLITDFAEENEKNDAIDLWDTQVAELKHVIGL